MSMAWDTNLSAPETCGPSMRLRIAVSVAALVMLLIIAQAIGLLQMYDELEEDFITNILAEQLEYSMALSHDTTQLALPNTPSMKLYRLLPGAPLPADLPAELAGLPIGDHEIFQGEQEFHIGVRQAADGSRFVLLYDETEHRARINAVKGIVISGALLLCLLVLVLVYALAGHLTRGLGILAERLEKGRGSSPYATPGMDRELLAVARALDEAVNRQSELLARERDFNAHLSHELRTPLAGIRSDAELMASNHGLPEAVHRRAARIMASTDRITQLAQSLLLLAREARPQLLEPIRLKDSINTAWSSLTAHLSSAAPPLELQIPEAAQLEADPALLQLVLHNLLDNALQHGEGKAITCRLEGHCLQVMDQGPGFRDADLPHVFDRFYRRSQSQGHGLGLALVRHICQACGWQIQARQRPEGGALLELNFAPALP